MKVAIWGSMNFGNFGDDVMNVLMGIRLKELGCTPYLYRLNRRIAQDHGLYTVDTLKELIEDAAFAIIGGGSWLESKHLGDDYENDFKDLLFHLESYKVPLHVISIGGDKKNEFSLLSKERQDLFLSEWFRGGTVRFYGDVKTLSDSKKPIQYFPDIVLLGNEFFSKKTKNLDSKKVLHIGITTWQSKDLEILIRLVKLINLFGLRIKLTFIRTHLEEYGVNYEYIPENISGNSISVYQYRNLNEFYGMLTDLDLIISFKLHPGVAALSVDTPFFWIGGNKKVLAFLETINKQDVIFNYRRIIKYLLKGELRSNIESYSFDEVHRAQKDAQGHLEYLKSLVDLYRSN